MQSYTQKDDQLCSVTHTHATVPAAWGHNRHIHVVGYRCVGHIAVAGRAAAAAAAAGRIAAGRIAAGRIAAVDICKTPDVSVCVRVNTRIMWRRTCKSRYALTFKFT